MEIMRELKRLELWQVTEGETLAGKRGRWIAGNKRALKESEHYPEHFGLAVAMILASHPHHEILNSVKSAVVAELTAARQPHSTRAEAGNGKGEPVRVAKEKSELRNGEGQRLRVNTWKSFEDTII